MTLQYAYCAGIIDGEGYVGFHKRKASLRAKIIVDMSCLKTVEHLRTTFGVGTIRPRKPRLGKKPLYRWTVECLSARQVAKLILPYVVTKRDEVEMLAHQVVRKYSRERIDKI